MLESSPEIVQKFEDIQNFVSLGIGGMAVVLAAKAGEAGMTFLDTYAVKQRGFVISAVTAYGAHKDSKNEQS